MTDEHREKCHTDYIYGTDFIHDLIKTGTDYIYDLCKYKKNIYSQNGEDGAIERLLDILDIKTGWCCEFGAWDGKYLSNTFHLIEQGWEGVYIENDKERFSKLKETQKEYPENLIVFNETVHYLPDKGLLLDDILARTPMPKNFDILSIDVDGPDYHIWKSLKEYRPKIVIIEASGLDGYYIQREGAYDADKKSPYQTTSAEPLRELGKEKGYTLIALMGNMFFLENDEYTLHQP